MRSQDALSPSGPQSGELGKDTPIKKSWRLPACPALPGPFPLSRLAPPPPHGPNSILSFKGKQVGSNCLGVKQPYHQAQAEFSISPRMAGPFPSRRPVTHTSCQGSEERCQRSPSRTLSPPALSPEPQIRPPNPDRASHLLAWHLVETNPSVPRATESGPVGGLIVGPSAPTTPDHGLPGVTETARGDRGLFL